MKVKINCYLHTDTDIANRFGDKYHFSVYNCEMNYTGSSYALLAVQEVEFEVDEELAIQAQLDTLKNKESDLRAKMQKELDGIAQQRQRLLSLAAPKTENSVEVLEAEGREVEATENAYEAYAGWHEYYFTYGVGTKNANCYSVVFAKNLTAARSYMFSKAGAAWAFCYTAEDFSTLKFPPTEVVPCGPSPIDDELP